MTEGSPTDQGLPLETRQAQLHTDLNRLSDEVERLNGHRFVQMHNSPMRLISFHFLRGLAFGLGTALGASLLVSLLVLLLGQIEVVPIIGGLATDVLQEIERAR
ncbi:MAG: DUF5665 domain-containing protein [Pelagimonas sp.]|jgi:hypothetical protein|nr:DUF5665 domain-containing protein [Pelagimonas sp.]